jgi:hypothetical protein
MLTRIGTALAAAIALSAAAFAQSFSTQSDFGKDVKPSSPSTATRARPAAPAILNTSPYSAQTGTSPPPSALTGSYSSTYESTYGAAPGNR